MWYGDLPGDFNVTKIEILSPNSQGSYLANTKVGITTQSDGTCRVINQNPNPGEWTTFVCPNGGVVGDVVHIQQDNASDPQRLSFCGIKVWGTYVGTDP